jgi:hypothetical protein
MALARPAQSHQSRLALQFGRTAGEVTRNELMYGYSWHSCPASHNPRVQKLPSNPCIEWNFLNVSTGRQIDDTTQM